MFGFFQKGDFKNIESFLGKMSKGEVTRRLGKYGEIGVRALAAATPKDSGLSADSWGYTISNTRGIYEIQWTNSNIVGGVPVVILLQYGHGTGTGGYVRGRDFINPAVRGIFEQIADEVWKVVTSA